MAENDFRELSRKITTLANLIPTIENELVKVISTSIVESVIDNTPVDEGVARSNWQVSLQRPVFSTRAAFAPGKRLGISETANAEAAKKAAKDVISQRNTGQRIIIQNNVPYIQELDRGSSRQAPANFVATATTTGIEALKNVRIRLELK